MGDLDKKLRDSVSIKKIRDQFTSALPKNRAKFDPKDVERILTDDWYVKRFLIARNRSPTEAYEMILRSLEWRHSQGFADLPSNHFPQEFYFVNPLFDYEPDRQGNVTIHFRARYVLRCGQLVPHCIHWGSKFFYDLEKRCETSFFTVVIDISGCGLRNVEFDFIKRTVTIIKNYVPACIKRILIVDVPPILRWAYTFIKGWIPDSGRSLIQFITRAQLTEYIDAASLPDYLDGTCTRPYQGIKMVPQGSPTAVDYCLRLGVTEDQCLKIAKIYEPLIREIGLHDKSTQADFVNQFVNQLQNLKEGKSTEMGARPSAACIGS